MAMLELVIQEVPENIMMQILKIYTLIKHSLPKCILAKIIQYDKLNIDYCNG